MIEKKSELTQDKQKKPVQKVKAKESEPFPH